MNRNQYFFLRIIIIAVMFCAGNVSAQISVSPRGFAFQSGDEAEQVVVTIANSTDAAVGFSVKTLLHHWEMNDEQHNQPRRDRRGGPDEPEENEYFWRDSDENDGPVFNWIDISEFEDVTPIENPADDSFHGMFDLGFEFEYFEGVYESVGMHTNGWASFVNAADIGFFYPQWLDWELPHANNDPPPPPTIMCVNYQDLNPAIINDDVGGEMFFWTDENSMAILQWENVAHFADGNRNQARWTFQIILEKNGLVTFQYESVGIYDEAVDEMIGLQNEDRDVGFTVSRNENDYISEELAIAFGKPASWVRWLSYENRMGEIEANGETEFVATVDPTDLEDGVYWADLAFQFDDGITTDVIIPVIMSVGLPVNSVTGSVISSDEETPIANAQIELLPTHYMTYTDEEGNFVITGLPLGTYTVQVNHPDYFGIERENVVVEEDEETHVAFALQHAELNIDSDGIEVSIETDFELFRTFTVANGGDAPVTFSTRKALVRENNPDTWEGIQEINVTELTEDTFINGVTFLDGKFYVAGGNSGEDLNKIYIISEEGELEGSFDQFMMGRNGLRDLTNDGTNIWGVDAAQVYGFSTEGEEVVHFQNPINPVRGTAWDSDRNLLWLTGQRTAYLLGFDIDGQQVVRVDKAINIAVYGMTYYSEDPDGYNMYIFSRDPVDDEGSETNIYKMNLNTGEMLFVTDLNEALGRASGIDITTGYDPFSWTMVGILEASGRDPDFIKVWHVAGRTEWFMVEPPAGQIAEGRDMEFEVTFSSYNMPEAEFTGEIIFDHDGMGQQSILSVSMIVTSGPVQTIRALDLATGWNLVSLNIQPNWAEVDEVTRPLVENGALLFMKDGAGNFYRPDPFINNMPDWSVAQGYFIKVNRPVELIVAGESIVADDPIQLREGWQIISYYPRNRIMAQTALSGITEDIVMVKDGFGNFYIPEYNFSNIGYMEEGRGYLLKMAQDAELIYNINDDQVNSVMTSKPQSPTLPNTGANMSVLIKADTDRQLPIQVIFDGKIVGYGMLDNGYCGVAVWGDDPLTSVKEGPAAGEDFTIVWADTKQPVKFNSIAGELRFVQDGFAAVEIINEPLPESFAIADVYPNPFNSSVKISFDIPQSGEVGLKLFDMHGRLVNSIQPMGYSAGSHKLQIDGRNLSSGLYFIQLEFEGLSLRQKIVLVK